MALKTFKPYTPARRFLTMLDKSEITKETPEKSLTESKKRTGGRRRRRRGFLSPRLMIQGNLPDRLRL